MSLRRNPPVGDHFSGTIEHVVHRPYKRVDSVLLDARLQGDRVVAVANSVFLEEVVKQ
jgi:hypothetical protein